MNIRTFFTPARDPSHPNRPARTAWSLDSPDELAWLESLDPEFRGIGDNPVFRYLRYMDRRKLGISAFGNRLRLTLPLAVWGGLVLLLVGPTLARYGLVAKFTINTMAYILMFGGTVQALRLGFFSVGDADAYEPYLREIRLRAEALEFGRLNPRDLAIGLWAHRAQTLLRRSGFLGWCCVAFGAAATFLVHESFFAIWLGSAGAGLGSMALAARRAPQIPALCSTVRDMRAAASEGTATTPYLGPARHGQDAIILGPILVALLFSRFIHKSNLPDSWAAVGLNLIVAGVFAWLGRRLGRAASIVTADDREKWIGMIRVDAKILITHWAARSDDKAIGLVPPPSPRTSEENPARIPESADMTRPPS